MWIGLIGPLMLESSKGTVAIPAAKHRVMLAMLALRAGRVVSFEELAEAAWDEPAPHTARVTVRNYILRLRKLLDLDGYLIRTKDPGYLLDVSPGNVDALRFCELCETGCSLARSGEWGQAGRMLREALALWRGTPLADIPSQALHDRWSGYLEQVRLRALRYRIQGDLHLGQHEAVTGELRELTTAHPLDEELWALLLLALYRSGRQGDALTAYRRAREVLVAELGVEPGPALGRLHQQILAHDPALDVAAPIVETLGGPGGGTPTSADGSRASAAVPVPRQLPAAMPAFAGRAHELKLLDDLLADATQGGGTVMISAIGGTAGVGKTTLALHFAHRVAERFPDGQLYVDLHGFHPSGEPASAGQAIGGFLDALGAPSDQMPADLDARAALYRSLLAGKQMLIVLDNAWDAAQVRPLLPGTPGCLVLVTSRNRLASLAVSDGARLLSLDLLTEPEARDLLAARLGAEAIAGQPQATADLITLCARLPLALAVAASRAVVRPAVPLSSLVAQVRSERDLLAALDAGEEAASVRAVFAWSHQQLTEPTARMFRLLGIHPGPDITTAAAASLAGVSPPQAREALRELTATGLLTEHVPGRYQFHDLLRHYAAELASTADSEENRHRTVCRMLDHYLHTANGLAGRGWRVLPLAAPASGVTPEPVPRGNGMAWIEAEHQVLLRLIEHAAASGFDSHAWQLLWAIAHYHDHRGYWDDWVTVHETALAAAQRGGDQDGLARSRYILGKPTSGSLAMTRPVPACTRPSNTTSRRETGVSRRWYT